MISADSPEAPYVPAVGDPFTGSYTFNSVAISSVNGQFFEGAPANVAADLEVHTLMCAFQPGSVFYGSASSFTIISTPSTYTVNITPLVVAATEIYGLVPGMDFSWNLSNPSGVGAPSTELSSVPPDLSVWTQASDAVSLQLFDTDGVEYRATGVIDTIQTR